MEDRGEEATRSSENGASENGREEEVADRGLKEEVKWRMFGRERSVHHVLGGGRPADVVLWREKKTSAGLFTCATIIWALFEVVEYHLLTLVCHCLMVSLGILFVWSNVVSFVNKTPPHIPQLSISEDFAVNTARALRSDFNQALALLHNVATGGQLRNFIAVMGGLWISSIFGRHYSFLSAFYTAFVLVHTVPVLYEKFENEVDSTAEKAMIELKKQYAIFEEKILSKIPRGLLKDKKH